MPRRAPLRAVGGLGVMAAGCRSRLRRPPGLAMRLADPAALDRWPVLVPDSLNHRWWKGAGLGTGRFFVEGLLGEENSGDVSPETA